MGFLMGFIFLQKTLKPPGSSRFPFRGASHQALPPKSSLSFESQEELLPPVFLKDRSGGVAKGGLLVVRLLYIYIYSC